MLSNKNTRILLIVLGALLALYFVTDLTQNGESNYKTQLQAFDTASVNRIELVPPSPSEKIEISKQDGRWMVMENGNSYSADNSAVNRMLIGLNGTRVKSVVASTPDAWEKYRTTDSLGTRIRLMDGEKVLSDILIGKYDYVQPGNQNPSPYNRRQIDIVGHVKLAGDDAVYAIDGTAVLGLGKSAADFSDKLLTRLNAKKINKVELSFADSVSLTLVKANNRWELGGGSADSATVEKYVRQLANLRGYTFSTFTPASNDVFATLTIESEEGSSPVVLTAYLTGTGSYYFVSSQNPTNIFRDKDKKLKDKILVTKSYLEGETQ